jgi:hypothetical protein
LEREIVRHLGETSRERERERRERERECVTWEKYGESIGLTVLPELRYLGYVILLQRFK